MQGIDLLTTHLVYHNDATFILIFHKEGLADFLSNHPFWSGLGVFL